MGISKLVLILLIYIAISFRWYSQAFDKKAEEKGDIQWWCKTTPHPDQCNHYLGNGDYHKPRHRAEFRTLMIQVALQRAIASHNCTTVVHRAKKKCQSKKRMVAWNDCCKLFNNTILQLNQTLEGLKNNVSNEFDTQTWLSTALTNLETCWSGSRDLNVSNFNFFQVSNNISELLSNSLAINGALLNQQPKKDEHDHDDHNRGFPKWVTAGDRRLLATTSWSRRANLVVAKDGSGRFRTIQSALNYAAKTKVGSKRYVIYIKRGVYRENIVIGNNLNKIMLVGDGLRYTIITGSRSVAGGFTTYSSATVGVDGIGFIARSITFRNTAGPQKGQAVALRSSSDLSVFYTCAFEGYQDTLFVLAQRQFYKSCYIYGTIDFIFGNAAVVFQSCVISVRRPIHGQINVITAQGRADPFQNTGISIHNSRVVAAADLKPVIRSVQTYLGRPWQQYSQTVYLKTFIDGLVHPAGWLAWEKSNFAWNTLHYGEYRNFGPGSSTRNRVKWKGYHVIRSATEASRFTVGRLIAGQSWLPATGIPFTSGL